MSRPDQRSYDSEQRQRALALADEIGSARAAAQLGIPAGTLRYWRSEAGAVAPPPGADPAGWAARKQAGADGTWNAAMNALAKVHELVDAGKTLDAQRAALTMAVALDKSAMLEQAAERAQARQAALGEEVGQVIADVIRQTLSDLGIPLGPTGGPLSAVVAHHLRCAEAGERVSEAPEATAARAELQMGRAG